MIRPSPKKQNNEPLPTLAKCLLLLYNTKQTSPKKFQVYIETDPEVAVLYLVEFDHAFWCVGILDRGALETRPRYMGTRPRELGN